MKLHRTIFLFTISLLCALNAMGQVSISGTNFQSFNVTPISICQAILLNPQGETNVTLNAKIMNSSGEVLLSVNTEQIRLHSGVNVLQSQQIAPVTISYGTSAQSVYVQNNKQLPSGNFRHCITVIGGGGEPEDEYCEDMESSTNSFLNLVSPFDRDTIDTPTPLLMWTHSEAFNLLAAGESFRLVLVVKNSEQDAESAVISNIPVYTFNNILRHDLQYPFDAPQLKQGITYAWQVQKMGAGGQGIIAKTEAWIFTLNTEKKIPDQKYAVMKKKPDAGYYFAANEKIFFRFDESYAGSNVKCRILNELNQEVKPELENETKKEQGTDAINAKSTGYNRFELDLAPLNLKSGYYFLEVTNEKNDKYILKFYVE